jgi:probable rRNA maturation factor
MISFEMNQAILSGSQRIAEPDVRKLLAVISKTLVDKQDHKVSIAFVDQKTIKRLNKEYRAKDQVTDVLSFKIDQPEVLGEVLVCYDIAKKQAKEKKTRIKQEIKLLITHGVLHLLGFDHEKDKEAEIMETLQDWVVGQAV